MSTYSKYGKKFTPQSKPLDERQVQNNAGGYTYEITKWDALDRFLILGTEGGTYYVQEQELTERNAGAVLACIKEDGVRVVHRIANISDEGRAAKNTPALFALALCSAYGDEATKQQAYHYLPVIARTGYHLLMWAAYTKNNQGTGMGWRKAVTNWFNKMPADRLAYQAVKYTQREGWRLADLLRLAHPKPWTGDHDIVFKWLLGKDINELEGPMMLHAADFAKRARSYKDTVKLIDDYNIPREVIQTEHLNHKEVWEAMIPKMPLTAMIRNLGKMTKVGALAPFSVHTQHVVDKLNDMEYLKRSRVHPMAVLTAMKIYGQGQGLRGSLRWDPVPQILDALDEAFYKTFMNVEPTGEKYLLGLDVSGSMSVRIMNSPLSAREATAAMALITMNAEKNTHVIGFTAGDGDYWHKGAVSPLSISPRQRLDDVVNYMARLNFGRTDCALPMIYAKNKSLEVDKFVIYTDNETWAGGVHPQVALTDYRNKFNAGAKSIVVGMTATNFSIADPQDPLALDVVGFDTATPQVISDF